jgi:hypothetical protein
MSSYYSEKIFNLYKQFISFSYIMDRAPLVITRAPSQISQCQGNIKWRKKDALTFETGA